MLRHLVRPLGMFLVGEGEVTRKTRLTARRTSDRSTVYRKTNIEYQVLDEYRGRLKEDLAAMSTIGIH